MSGKQIGFMILVVLMCAICHRPESLNAAPVKCANTGCWTMLPEEWEFSGSGICYSYNKNHAPYATMSTMNLVGGKHTAKVGQQVASYKSKANCNKACEAAGRVQAARSRSRVGVACSALAV